MYADLAADALRSLLDRPQLVPATRANYGRWATGVAATALAYACGGRALAAAKIAGSDVLAPLRRRLDRPCGSWSLDELIAHPYPPARRDRTSLLNAGLSLLGAPDAGGQVVSDAGDGAGRRLGQQRGRAAGARALPCARRPAGTAEPAPAPARRGAPAGGLRAG